MVNSKQSAFPSWDKTEDGKPIFHPGVNKREYFAAMAMQGYIAAGSMGMPGIEDIATRAIQTADELLKQLDNKQVA